MSEAWRRRLRTVEAALCLAVALVSLRFQRFATIARLASRRAPAGKGAAVAERARALEVAQAVVSASRRLPWRSACFARGLACHAMLRRRGIAATLHYGARAAPGEPLQAHVWVSAAGVGLVGAAEACEFVQLDAWPRPPAKPA